MPLRNTLVLGFAVWLAACSGSDTSPPAVDAAAAAKAAADAKAVAAMKLYDQMRANQSWDLASTLGDELLKKYPGSTAANQVQQTIVDVRAKATAQGESRRLARLWAYNAVSESGGVQYTAAIVSKQPLKGAADAKKPERIRLVLRQHPKWGQSVYLLLDNATFDCSKGCATLAVRFDDAPQQRMKATIPPTGEPALFIDDDKGVIAKIQKAKTLAVDVPVKGEGEQTVVFEVGGFDATKLPDKPKK
jgi:hypothetical protein